MYHEMFPAHINAMPCTTGEIILRQFIQDHAAALADSAALLVGRTGTRIVSEISEGLSEPRPLTRRLCRRLFDLQGILLLEHDIPDDPGCCQVIDPMDPVVPEICLLADQFSGALLSSGLTDPRGICAAT